MSACILLTRPGRLSTPSWKVAKDKGILEDKGGSAFQVAQSKGFINPGLGLICMSTFTCVLFSKSQLLFTREGKQQSGDDLEQTCQPCEQTEKYVLCRLSVSDIIYF